MMKLHIFIKIDSWWYYKGNVINFVAICTVTLLECEMQLYYDATLFV